MNAHDLIIRPVISEKSMEAAADRQYTFVVQKTASKTQIRDAVEEVFGVQVERVNTVSRMGKMKRQGATQGHRPATKKAIVTLKAGSKGIEFFDSMAQ